MHYVRVLFFCCLSYLLSASVVAQQAAASLKPDGELERKKKELIEKKTMAMLDELLDAAPSFRLPENRVWILAVAAEVLWERDEKRARSLFDQAIHAFGSIDSQDDFEVSVSQSSRFRQLRELRRQLVLLLGQYDPHLARNFLVVTRPDPENVSPGYHPSQESELEMNLAQKIAEKDPQLSFKRAQEMLAEDKSLHSVIGILETLRSRDIEIAQSLAGLLVVKLQAENSKRDDAIYASLRVLNLAAHPAIDSSNATKTKQLLSSTQARSLIESVVSEALSQTSGGKRRLESRSFLIEMKHLSSYMEAHAPASLLLLKREWAEVERTMDPTQRQWMVLNELSAKGVDKLVAAAEEAPIEMRPAYYQHAVRLAIEKRDDQRAKQIIDEKLRDPHRAPAQSMLDHLRLERKSNEGKFEEALQILSTKSKVERVNAIIQIATKAGNGGHHELAARILDEAWAMVEGPLRSREQFEFRVQISNAYLPFAPTRSFEILEATIDLQNELFAATSVLRTFEANGTFREREMVLYTGGAMPFNVTLLARQLAGLTTVDPERVHKIIARFAFPDQRAGVQLEVLRHRLRESKARTEKVHQVERR